MIRWQVLQIHVTSRYRCGGARTNDQRDGVNDTSNLRRIVQTGHQKHDSCREDTNALKHTQWAWVQAEYVLRVQSVRQQADAAGKAQQISAAGSQDPCLLLSARLLRQKLGNLTRIVGMPYVFAEHHVNHVLADVFRMIADSF